MNEMNKLNAIRHQVNWTLTRVCSQFTNRNYLYYDYDDFYVHAMYMNKKK